MMTLVNFSNIKVTYIHSADSHHYQPAPKSHPQKTMESKAGLLLCLLLLVVTEANAQLAKNFYSKSCPNVESIVQKAVYNKFLQTFATIPGTLRLFQHDCFVDVTSHSFKTSNPRLTPFHSSFFTGFITS